MVTSSSPRALSVWDVPMGLETCAIGVESIGGAGPCPKGSTYPSMVIERSQGGMACSLLIPCAVNIEGSFSQ